MDQLTFDTTEFPAASAGAVTLNGPASRVGAAHVVPPSAEVRIRLQRVVAKLRGAPPPSAATLEFTGGDDDFPFQVRQA